MPHPLALLGVDRATGLRLLAQREAAYATILWAFTGVPVAVVIGMN